MCLFETRFLAKYRRCKPFHCVLLRRVFCCMCEASAQQERWEFGRIQQYRCCFKTQRQAQTFGEEDILSALEFLRLVKGNTGRQRCDTKGCHNHTNKKYVRKASMPSAILQCRP